jgi:cytochrome c oxidase subunit 2
LVGSIATQGKDNVFGKRYYKNINDAKQDVLGMVWEDKFSHDDIIDLQKMYIVKDRPVKLIINSRDVIHDVGLAHFRLKMDAVPVHLLLCGLHLSTPPRK